MILRYCRPLGQVQDSVSFFSSIHPLIIIVTMFIMTILITMIIMTILITTAIMVITCTTTRTEAGLVYPGLRPQGGGYSLAR